MDKVISNIRTKIDLYRILDSMNLKIGVEVGVLRGLNSEEILNNSNIKLYSIDHWNNNDKSDLSNLEDYVHTTLRLYKYANRSVVINDEAQSALNLFNDKSVDFAYIDAGLTYELYFQMVKQWWPKVREGGLLCGHLFEFISDGVTIQESKVAEQAINRFREEIKSEYQTDTHIVLNRQIPINADINSYKGSKSWIIQKIKNS